jgi:hybrid cluster-associated redox disulfide protein
MEKIKLPVTKDTNLAQLLFSYPETAEILLDYGLHCVGCFANAFDSLEAGTKVHGFSEEYVQEIIDRVNEVIEHGE